MTADRVALPRLVLVVVVGEPLGDVHATDVTTGHRQNRGPEPASRPRVDACCAELATRHDLLLLTKGQAAEQQRKIDASGLAEHFRSTHIVAEKATDTYRALLAEQRLATETTWMIGNSPRSDIVAAREAGWRAVFIPHTHTWSLEDQEIDPADPGVLRLTRFPELLEHF